MIEFCCRRKITFLKEVFSLIKKGKLETFANFQSGLVLRRKQATKKDETEIFYKALTLKSIDSDGWLNEKYLDTFISNENLEERYLTKETDIVIRLSAPYTAVTIKKHQENLVVSSLFVIVSINTLDIISEYLSFVLNSDSIKQEYLRSSLGVTIPMIRMGPLKETMVEIPTLESQKKIVEVVGLMIDEKQKYQDLMKLKEVYFKELTKRILGGNKND